MRCSVPTWLWCLWRVRSVYRTNGLMFSQRLRFLEELRPLVKFGGKERIAYPDAIFWIQPHDVERAHRAALEQLNQRSDK